MSKLIPLEFKNQRIILTKTLAKKMEQISMFNKSN